MCVGLKAFLASPREAANHLVLRTALGPDCLGSGSRSAARQLCCSGPQFLERKSGDKTASTSLGTA